MRQLAGRSVIPRIEHTKNEGVESTSSASGSPPDWAKSMKRSQQMSHGVQAAAHAVRSGDASGPGSSINLSESDR
jgi:type IV secretion system protein TrbL